MTSCSSSRTRTTRTRIVKTFMDAVPSGSYLVDLVPRGGARARAASRRRRGRPATTRWSATPMNRRSRDEIVRFFEGIEIVEPGYVHMSRWRPDPEDELPERYSPAHRGRRPQALRASRSGREQELDSCGSCSRAQGLSRPGSSATSRESSARGTHDSAPISAGFGSGSVASRAT